MIVNSLNPAPMGMPPEGLPEDSDDALEIILLDEEGMAPATPDMPAPPAFTDNLANVLEEGVLDELSGQLIADFNADIEARKAWSDTYIAGLELLGLKYEERTKPWEGACGVFYPLLGEAVVRFQSEAIMATFPAAGPVRTQIIGRETPQTLAASKRVQEDMNYRVTEVMEEYRSEHERMLWSLALAGSAFKKVYYDPTLGREVSLFIPAEDLVVPYGASTLRSAERVTHVMRKTKNELRKLQVGGFYRDIDLDEPIGTLDGIEQKKADEQGMPDAMDSRHKLLEVHVDLVLKGIDDEEQPASPYVVTLDKESGKVLSVYRNWLEEDPLRLKRAHFVHYVYIPGFGFYGYGLIHLIGGFAKSGTSLLRQLVDAGTLANLPGGFKTKGLRIKGDDTPISPAEFRDVDVPSGVLRDNIMPLPYKEPSQVLAGLLDRIVAEARRFAATADMQISDISANTPVGTTLAVLERTLKVMSAVHARLHAALRQELKLLKALVRDYLPDAYGYQPDGADAQVKKADYDMVEVLPVSDPNASTMAQRVVQYQAVLQLAQQAPQIYDIPKLHRQMIDVLGIDNAEQLIPLSNQSTPQDPVTENMNMLIGKPVKAFLHQDHAAHLATHLAASKDPMIMGQLQQQPNAPMVQGAFFAHINEHMAMQYRKQIEQQLGVALPPPEQPLPPEIEVQLSALIAEGAQQLLQQNQAAAQQQQAQQQMQDPMLQLEMKDREIEQMKVQQREAESQRRATIEREKIASDERQSAQTNAARLMESQAEAASRDQADTKKIRADMAKTMMTALAQAKAKTPPAPKGNA
jgi:hypothetical protein